jgi:uncharacterized membrane protein
MILWEFPTIGPFIPNEIQVIRIRQDFMKLRTLTDEVNRFLAPLMITSYFVHLLSISIFVRVSLLLALCDAWYQHIRHNLYFYTAI